MDRHWRIEMAWQHRLPDGVRHEGGSRQGFTLSVSLPVGDDGLAPLLCPADAGHRFKITLTQSAPSGSSDCYCPYCGTQATTDEFLADQRPPGGLGRARRPYAPRPAGGRGRQRDLRVHLQGRLWGAGDLSEGPLPAGGQEGHEAAGRDHLPAARGHQRALQAAPWRALGGGRRTQVWAALLQAAAIRHMLTHNAGVIDAKFLNRVTSWPQHQGERLQVRRAEADRFLDVLEQFAAAVLSSEPTTPSRPAAARHPPSHGDEDLPLG